jgi:hypothetical protein
MRTFISFILLLYTTILVAQDQQITLKLDSAYPRWLKTESNRTDQTSGIAYIKSDSSNEYFLLADDIGKIRSLTIHKDNSFEISDISFADSVQEFFSSFPKEDFEEIVYDKYSNSVYLSIEGNGDNYKKYVGIFKLHFNSENFPYKEITYFEKINFAPNELFLEHTYKNIGYEGLAVDHNYFYLGLESFLKNYQFADSTVIFIATKSDKQIIKQIHTKNLGIHTICGLYSDKDFSLWGIDRNQRKIFHINFDVNFNVINCKLFDCSTEIPGYNNLNYKPSLESITEDDDGNLFLVDDPWKQVYVPDEDVLNQLDSETIENFRDFIPTIFKYKIINK